MTQLEIAALAVGAFGLFMFGYSLGWMQRGQRLRISFDRDGECLRADRALSRAEVDEIRRVWREAATEGRQLQ
ncbi:MULTISPECIES: hypothetical protein [Bradyrhizobium]|jgi:hypothetical protein|uniref:hypothetical protein n=1 Tax=Bradyrhizobium TaxID=374 RepID=UPI0004B794D2|nr:MULTISPECIES: hypothetical protein [Bradyrhizobium]MDI2110456.1 hypothetical protein [Bradyrhizobium sp. Mp64]WLB04494.1 hypothetical protein QNJ80_21880 [Bradyrhizobium elkanii]